MKRISAVLALVLVAALGSPAMAQDEGDGDGLPAGKFGISVGVRQGVGSLGGDFGLGAVGAVEAGFHPGALDRLLSAGLHWSVIWGWFGFDDAASVTGSLKLLEFNFGLRFRRQLAEGAPRFLVIGGGATLLRSNVPIPPDSERVYLGPYLTLGVEQFVSNSVILSFEARYALLFNGPGGISLALGISFGR